jgi:2-polyprenyl-3-methyl-5-hydroxy-6-metoxy-1,4-benzoquinol methylase
LLTYTLHDLETIRDTEMDIVLERHASAFANAAILEIGAGNCRQLKSLEKLTRLAVGIDIPASDYQPESNTKFVRYDGSRIPFNSGSFDVIYSSNVMEHVADERQLHDEMRRILRSNGVAIHVVPSSSWRLWTTLTYFLVLPKLVGNFLRRAHHESGQASANKPQRQKSLWMIGLDLICPQRHGERGNRFTEWWHFRKDSWYRRFEELGWIVESVEGTGLFYTGYLVGTRLIPIKMRKRLSRVMGSSCFIFILTPKRSNT